MDPFLWSKAMSRKTSLHKKSDDQVGRYVTWLWSVARITLSLVKCDVSYTLTDQCFEKDVLEFLEDEWAWSIFMFKKKKPNTLFLFLSDSES